MVKKDSTVQNTTGGVAAIPLDSRGYRIYRSLNKLLNTNLITTFSRYYKNGPKI
jgi:hypothetical protein